MDQQATYLRLLLGRLVHQRGHTIGHGVRSQHLLDARRVGTAGGRVPRHRACSTASIHGEGCNSVLGARRVRRPEMAPGDLLGGPLAPRAVVASPSLTARGLSLDRSAAAVHSRATAVSTPRFSFGRAGRRASTGPASSSWLSSIRELSGDRIVDPRALPSSCAGQPGRRARCGARHRTPWHRRRRPILPRKARLGVKMREGMRGIERLVTMTLTAGAALGLLHWCRADTLTHRRMVPRTPILTLRSPRLRRAGGASRVGVAPKGGSPLRAKVFVGPESPSPGRCRPARIPAFLRPFARIGRTMRHSRVST